MTLQFWTERWFYWLLAVLLSWMVLEAASIFAAHMAGAKDIVDWTLSDTIRRWSVLHRWLAPVSSGFTMFLWAHFFIEQNPT